MSEQSLIISSREESKEETPQTENYSLSNPSEGEKNTSENFRILDRFNPLLR